MFENDDGKNCSLLSDKQVAQKLNCGVSTIWRWSNEGIIPKPIKICGVTRWKSSEIADFINTKTAE